MFIEALFTIAKLWKQPRCPTTEEVHNYCVLCTTVVYFFSILKNGFKKCGIYIQ
jgi:hypothetical protein